MIIDHLISGKERKKTNSVKKLKVVILQVSSSSFNFLTPEKDEKKNPIPIKVHFKHHKSFFLSFFRFFLIYRIVKT